MSKESNIVGYHGKDSMRDNAEKLLDKKSMNKILLAKSPESSSSTGLEKLRIYKKGGFVHKMNKPQTDLVLPKKINSPSFKQESLSKASKLKKGGKVSKVKK